jgi:hypothetical protein
MKLSEFIFTDKFPQITDVELQRAVSMINAMFYGIDEMWSGMPQEIAEGNRRLLSNYLVAWQLTSMYPDKAVGVASMGALPISSKSIGPVAIRYRDSVLNKGSVLDALQTNWFGYMALLMIQTNSDNWTLKR